MARVHLPKHRNHARRPSAAPGPAHVEAHAFRNDPRCLERPEAKAGRVQTLPTTQTGESSEMPSPPFPSPNSEEAAAILRETVDRFSEDELMSAVAFAAG